MPPLPSDRDYIINVGPNGTFRRSGSYQTIPEDIDNMFARFEQDNIRKFHLYFHGGLVNEQGGMETAHKVYPYLNTQGSAPACFVWESGLIETVANNITKISETKLFNKLLKALLKKVTEKLGFNTPAGRGIAGPSLTDEEIEKELSQPDPFSNFNRAAGSSGRSAVNLTSLKGRESTLQAELEAEMARMIELDDEFKAAIVQTKLTTDATGPATGSRGLISVAKFIVHAAKIAFRVISRFIEKRDHDLYPTIVEEILRELYIAEIGAWVWKSMKDKAAGMWQTNAGRTGQDQYAARYFLDKLAGYKTKYPDTSVSLVGHSAGSIAICHLLGITASLANSFTFDHVLFMAPACRIDLFKKELVDNPSRFKDLRIFTMTDDYECKDRLVPYFYTHSLLYLVSGILEDEGDSYDAYILGLERHIAFQRPYDIKILEDTHKYIYEAGLNRSSFSVTSNGTGDGLTTTSQSHGGFDDDESTMKSVQYILEH